jgi:PTH1 family peptidyl-tRNA hydrolase
MLIVGLGNPGSDYEKTRHNIGFMVVDALRKKLSATNVTSASFLGECFKHQNHFLLKPLTYMNLSGNSVIKVKNFYKIEQVVVIHDDLDLPFGALRFKEGGGHGGHNGLKSIDANIGREYIRVRMGIGKPEHKGEVASYVLSAFSVEQQSYLKEWIESASNAVLFLLESDIEKTSAKFAQKSLAC